MAEMLKIDHICKTFNAGTINEKVALNGVDLTLEDGDFVTVIGGNGAGKSTTLNAVAGVWPVDSGKIFIGGDDVTKLSEYKRAKYLGRVFQDPMTGTATTMSIEENMAIAARRGRKRGLSWGITKAERDTYREMLKTLDLGLEDRLTSKVGLLSGGQRQRVGVARAFATDSDLILMDEPFSALDPLTREELQDEIVKLQKEYEKTIVFVTHDMDEAIKCADKICFIQNGTVIQFDKTEEILRHPANDYVEKFVGKNRLWGNPKYIHASDIMCKEPYILSRDRTVIQALQVMRQNAINSILITEGKNREFQGIVWLEDLSKLDVQHMSASIGDMISSDYISVFEESSLQEIIDEIDYYKSGIIPVLNERRELRGVLTKSILLSTLSKRYKKEQEG